MRYLTDDEQRVISLLAEKFGSAQEKEQLMADIKNCSVNETVSDGSILSFVIDGYQRPNEQGRWQYRQQDGFVVDGVVKDDDGAEMEVMLLADMNHRIWELEIVRYNPGMIIKPDWSTFKVR